MSRWTERVCRGCKERLEINAHNFARYTDRRNGKTYWRTLCRMCQSNEQLARYHAKKAQVAAQGGFSVT